MEELIQEKKKRYDLFYMAVAEASALLSSAQRRKVGCVIVKDGNILSFGFNGMPHGFDNVCEDNIIVTKEMINSGFTTKNIGELISITKPEVLHSELNALMKIAKSTQSSQDASLYVTMSPCIECAKIILQSGIKEVFYRQKYRIEDGINFLLKAGIKIEQI